MYTCKLFLKSDKIVFSGNVMRNEKKKKTKNRCACNKRETIFIYVVRVV